MAVRTFAAIDLGSYELGMKIFEFTTGGMREIDYIRRSIELGTDTYQTGKIGREHMDEMCDALADFAQIMKGYKVNDYKAYGTSAIRETKNTVVVSEQIKLRSGLKVETLSNSEQRFLHYKAAASKGEIFNDFISDGCIIVDIGGGSIQVSLFKNDALVTTQNIRLGVLRIMDMLNSLEPIAANREKVLNELIDNQLKIFEELYLKNQTINNIILIDDYISQAMDHLKVDNRVLDSERFYEKAAQLNEMNAEQISRTYGIAEENAAFLPIAAAIVGRVLNITNARKIWSPGVSLCDGMAYEYGQKEKLLKDPHNFENDIIECATAVSRRYRGNLERNLFMEKIACALFDATKKIHGMSKREKLLLRIATRLNDCGRYISIDAGAECGYDIIMATEIIGLSHAEREIIANIVRFNKTEFRYYKELASQTLLTKSNYLRIAKLSSLLRLADGICRSYRVKIDEVKYTIKEDELIITVFSEDDIDLEKCFFYRKASLFEETFSIKPIIKNGKRRRGL